MKEKTLIVFYSCQGSTRRVAESIQKVTDGELYEIELDKPYSAASSYTRGLLHIATGHLPKLKNRINLEEYETIFIGTPVWGYTVSPPVKSFINKHSFEGKNIIPFCTHGGSVGNCFEKMKELCKGSGFSKEYDFINVSKMSGEALQAKVDDWLK